MTDLVSRQPDATPAAYDAATLAVLAADAGITDPRLLHNHYYVNGSPQ